MNNIINPKTGPVRINNNGRYIKNVCFSFIISINVLLEELKSILVSLTRSSSAGRFFVQFSQIDIIVDDKSVEFNIILGIVVDSVVIEE
jgi:hypothetical protein